MIITVKQSPQLPKGDVLVEPQAVVPLLLGHVAPPLPASTGGAAGSWEAGRRRRCQEVMARAGTQPHGWRGPRQTRRNCARTQSCLHRPLGQLG